MPSPRRCIQNGQPSFSAMPPLENESRISKSVSAGRILRDRLTREHAVSQMPQNNIRFVVGSHVSFKDPLGRNRILEKINIIFPALNLAIGSTSASPLNEVNEIDIEVSNSL